MAKNEEFLSYFNELNEECKKKYKINNNKENGIYKWAESKSDFEQQKLKNLITIRNILSHENGVYVDKIKVKEIKGYLKQFKKEK